MNCARAAAPVIAFAAIAIAAVSLYVFELPYAAVSCLLGWTMLAIAASDAARYIIPDALSLPSIPVGLLATYFLSGVQGDPSLTLEHTAAAIFGAALLYGVREAYFYWRDREGLGLGDVKLGAVAGAWTGFQGMTNVLLLGCILAITYIVAMMLWQRRVLSGATAMPFGVFLAPAIWIVWCANALAVAG
jgi:leader peptidase (prepilin peptidase) / N-methyltransferase